MPSLRELSIALPTRVTPRYTWRQCPTACSYGAGYWRICQYLDVCNGHVDIESLPKRDALARYAEEKP